MADEFVPEGIEYNDMDDHVAGYLATVADSQDQVVELLCNYRAKLLDHDFSEDATEHMVVQYHGQMRA